MAVYKERFFEALRDDFNTPAALAAAFEWIREANSRSEVGRDDLVEMLGVLGLENLLDAETIEAGEEAAAMLRAREEARAARDFAEADRLRDELRARGWEVRDGPAGPELVPVP
jgi:cysteinyl-tRNA synthetase